MSILQKIKEPIDPRVGASLIGIVLVIMVLPKIGWTTGWAFAGGLRWADYKILEVILGEGYIKTQGFWLDVGGRAPGITPVTVALIFFILGSFVAALFSKEFGIKIDKSTIPEAIIGGLLMGIGVVFISTCNIGIFLNSVPQLSIGGFIAAIGLLVGVYIGGKIYVKRMGL